MEYWFKIGSYNQSNYLNSNNSFKTSKIKRDTKNKAEKIAKYLSQNLNIFNLVPCWTSTSTFGWIICNYSPQKTGHSLIGRGGKQLAELVKDRYTYVVLANNIDSNIEENLIEDKKVLIININFFKEFIQTFSNSEKRIRLFIYRFDSSEDLDIVKRWMQSRPKELKETDEKIIPRDIFKTLEENQELFRDTNSTLRLLEIVKSRNFSKIDELKSKLSEFKIKIDTDVKETEINSFLIENPWLISFDYANLSTSKDKYYDVHIVEKFWDIRKDFIIELKKPSIKLSTKYSKHKVMSAALAKAISQCIDYLEENKEIPYNKGLIILGKGEQDLVQKINKYVHNIEILTYDKIYDQAERVLAFLEGKYGEVKKADFKEGNELEAEAKKGEIRLKRR